MANDYTLGRGELHFAQFAPNSKNPMGEMYFGNTTECNFTIEAETLDHYDSDHGVNELDFSIPLRTNRTGNFITDNISADNLGLFFFGKKSMFTSAAAVFTDSDLLNVIPGLTYTLGQTPENPVGARALDIHTPAVTLPTPEDAQNVIVKSADAATTYDEGIDYNIDMDRARLSLIVGGTIVAGSALKVSFKTKSSTRERIVSGSKAIEGAMRFLSFNAAGSQRDWYMPYVKITPNGDFALKGDELQALPFNVAILKLPTAEAIYIDGEPLVVT